MATKKTPSRKAAPRKAAPAGAKPPAPPAPPRRSPPPRPSDPIVFVVRGEEAASAGSREVRVASAARTARAAEHRLEAVPGRHVVELVVAEAGGRRLTLTLSPENARDLLLSQQGSGAARDAAAPGVTGEVRVPAQARWAVPPGAGLPDAASRGAADLVFETLKLVGVDLKSELADASAAAFRAWRDRKVDEGVYRLTREPPKPLKGQPKTRLKAVATPQLVMIHGTFVDTVSTFGKWWARHPGLVRGLFDAYGDEVYALDHATLGVSPIGNALTLARALPDGARLHLVTHSRGGLVAEALVRACAGIGPADLAFFPGDDYAVHRKELQDLGRELKGRNIRIERVVRVACPAHGTHLASGRLDAYFSVLRHLLNAVTESALDDVGDFIQEVARRRSSPEDFPGLESMLPGHPFARWANTPATVPGELRVVAGDVEPSLLDSWLRALVACALQPVFLSDNDLVVQTSSMYGGARRQGGASFLLERGSKVDHLHYFANDGTANAIQQALLLPQPPGFSPIGPLSQAGQDSSGSRAAPGARAARAVDPKRPAVILLPGIMGSHLKSPQAREWFVWWRLPGLADRIAWDPAGNPVSADAVLEDTYGDLIDYLSRSHDVQPMPFDWRAPLADSARLLAAEVERQLALRPGRPVRLLAHSMGGLVVRVMRLNHRETWDKMMARAQSRVVMLGTPNGGSWAPMSIFTNDDPLGQKLAALGGWLDDKHARDRFAGFPGLVQMQAGLLDTQLKLSQRGSWEELARRDAALAAQAAAASAWHSGPALRRFYEWALPAEDDLRDAAALRRRLDEQALALGEDTQRMAVVLGEAPRTPCGLDTSGGDIAYEFTAEGDGRVTWANTWLPGVPALRAPADHGDLAQDAALFRAYEDLLKGEGHGQLKPWAPASRGAGAGAAAAAVSWTGRTRGAPGTALPQERQLLRDLLGGALPAAGAAARARGRTLTLSVQHGDIRFTREPIMVGHSSSMELTGSEAVADKVLGGALREAMQAGLYPDAIGQYHVFDNQRQDPENPWAFPRPESVIVVGLGQESALKPSCVRKTVRLGVLAYLQRVAERRKAKEAAGEAPDESPIVLGMTSMGSGGALSVAESVINAVHGVLEANAQVPGQPGAPVWPLVAAVQFIEIYQERSAEAWQSLRLAVNSGDLDAQLPRPVEAGQGARRRPVDVNYRGAKHDLVRVTSSLELVEQDPDADDEDGRPQGEDLRPRKPKEVRVLEFTLFTHRARSEIRAKGTQRRLLRAVVEQAEASTRMDRELGRALYQLLMPQEMRPYLDSGSAVVLELDSHTAQYPWEMMDDRGNAPAGRGLDKPLGLRMGSLLRRLALRDFRPNPVDSPVEDFLVVGMSSVPRFRGAPLAELPGVRAEVEAVGKWLKVEPLLDKPFLEVVKPALARSWKVVHLSGHGIHEDGCSGMIMSDRTVFGPLEFESMDHVPELVFVNCCHLGKADEQQPLRRSVFAANVAEQLIRMGVRCVVAAGWAVDDDAARAFADAFYGSLMRGADFAGAVRNAREAAWQANRSSNTWAAYQCYGDAAWRLRNGGADNAPALVRSRPPEMANDSELRARLEEIEAKAGVAKDRLERDRLVDDLTQLLGLEGPRAAWLRHGRTAEDIARCWSALNQKDRAIEWYTTATQAADGTASLRAREQLINLRARHPATTARQRLELLKQLEALIAIGATPERWNLVGSTHKRIVMEDARTVRDVERHLKLMSESYARAAALKPSDLFYPAIQRFLALLRLHWLAPARHSLPGPEELGRLRGLLAEKTGPNADFWSVVAMAELDIHEALMARSLKSRLPAVLKELADVHNRLSHGWMWASVRDTARFMLEPYVAALKKGEEREAAAAARLAQQLDSYAG